MKLKDITNSFHNHTTFSLIDAVSTPEEMVKAHADRGCKFMALTDHGHTSGFYQLEEAAIKHGIQHIFGCEFYVDLPELKTYGHLTTLAHNDIGRKNVLTLFHKSWDTLSKAKFGKKKPQLTWELLEQYNEGIFVGTGCLVGVVSRCLLKGQPELAEKNLDHLIAIFGKDNVFAEFIPHIVDQDWDNKTNTWKMNECTEFAPDGDLQKGYHHWLWNNAVLKRGLKPVTTLDAHFTVPAKKSIQDAILMNGEIGWHFKRSHHILMPDEIYENLKYLPNFDNLMYEKMLMNGLDFCSDVKYSKMDKSIKLTFESPSVKDSLQMLGNAINMDVVRKINENYHKDCCK